MIRTSEACCETADIGYPCSCHIFKSHDDDGYGDWLYDQAKDNRMETEWEEFGEGETL